LHQGRFFSLFLISSSYGKRVGFSAKRGLPAVARNRIKRISRELWRIFQKEYEFTGDCIIIGREQILKTPFVILERDFRTILELIEKRRASKRQ
jgi:ribonuclease P protein component